MMVAAMMSFQQMVAFARELALHRVWTVPVERDGVDTHVTVHAKTEDEAIATAHAIVRVLQRYNQRVTILADRAELHPNFVTTLRPPAAVPTSETLHEALHRHAIETTAHELELEEPDILISRNHELEGHAGELEEHAHDERAVIVDPSDEG
jgi:hypothetical protein